MTLYGGIDLHSNNCYVALLDEGDRVVSDGRLPNDLEAVLQVLAPYRRAYAAALAYALGYAAQHWQVPFCQSFSFVFNFDDPLEAAPPSCTV